MGRLATYLGVSSLGFGRVFLEGPADGARPGTSIDLEALVGAAAGTGGPRLGLETLASLDSVLLVLWAGSAAVVLLHVVVSLFRLHRERRGWPERRIGDVAVLVSERRGPAVLGFRHAAVVLPRWALQLDAGLRQVICLHEAEHVRAGDQRTLLAALFAVALFPWNLPLWWQLRRLRLAVELDCDRRVLRRGVSPAVYGALLLRIGALRSSEKLALTGLAKPRSFLERRVRLMTNKPGKTRPIQAAVGLIFAVALLAVACEAPLPVESQAGSEYTASETTETTGTLTRQGRGEATLRELGSLERLGIGESSVGGLEHSFTVATDEMVAEREAQHLERTPKSPAALQWKTEAALTRVQGGAEEPSEGAQPTRGTLRRLVPEKKPSYRLREREAQPPKEVTLVPVPDSGVEAASRRAPVRVEEPFKLRVQKQPVSRADAPLVIVDGVIQANGLEGVDKSEIERIEVIKGGAARALYGERARNGVVQITTRKQQ